MRKRAEALVGSEGHWRLFPCLLQQVFTVQGEAGSGAHPKWCTMNAGTNMPRDTPHRTKSQLATACNRPLAKHCKVDAPAAAEAGSQAVGYRHCAVQSQVCPVQLPLQQRRACSLMRSWPLSTL